MDSHFFQLIGFKLLLLGTLGQTVLRFGRAEDSTGVLSISPSVSFLAPGSNETLLCTIDSTKSSRTSNELVWYENYPYYEKVISGSAVRTVNSTTLSLHLTNLTFDSEIYYFCMFEDAMSNWATLSVNALVRVGYKPSGVKNLTCRAENLASFYCWWIKGNTGLYTTHKLYFEDINKRWAVCENTRHRGPYVPSNVEGLMSCYYDLNGTHPLSLKVKVQETNRRGSFDTLAEFTMDEILQPNPVRNLQAVATDNYTVRVRADRPLKWSVSSVDGNLTFKIEIRIDDTDENNTFELLGMHTGSGLNKVFSKTIQPYAMYKVRVSVKPDRLGRGLWSSYEEVDLESPPREPEGAVTDLRLVQLNRRKYIRNVKISWTGIPENQENGPGFRYKVVLWNRTDVVQESNKLDEFSYFMDIKNFEEYTVTVTPVNDVGEAGTMSLTIPDLTEPTPSVPDQLEMDVISSSAVNLTWEEPVSPKGLIRGFKVQWINQEKRSEMGEDFVNMVEGQVQFHYSVHNLTAFGLHMFQVQVQSLVNKELGPAATVQGRTKQGVPANPPSNITVHSVSSTPDELQVRYQPPLPPHNGIIEAYNVYFIDVDNLEGERYNVSREYDLQATIKHLKPYTLYSVKVAAVTGAGEGPHSGAHVQLTAQGKPTSPSNVTAKKVTSSKVHISWSPPRTFNGIFSSYEVSYTRSGHNKPLLESTKNTSAVLNVEGYSVYTIKVRAYSEGTGNWAQGQWSSEIRVQTPVGAPKEVTNLQTKTYIDKDTIMLHWNDPSVRNGPIEKYLVSYHIEGASDKLVNYTVGRSEYNLKVRCPDNGKVATTFVVEVRAITKDNITGEEYVGDPVQDTANMCQRGGLTVKTILPGVLVPATILVFLLTIYVWKCQSDIKKSIPEPFFVDAVLTSMNTGAAWGQPHQQFFLIEKECFDPLKGVDDSTQLLSPGIDTQRSKQNSSTSTDQGIHDMDGDVLSFFHPSRSSRDMNVNGLDSLSSNPMGILSEDYDEDAVFEYPAKGAGNGVDSANPRFNGKHGGTPPNSPVSSSTGNLSTDQADSGNGSGSEYSKMSEMQPLMSTSHSDHRPRSEVSDEGFVNYMKVSDNLETFVPKDSGYVGQKSPFKSGVHDPKEKEEKSTEGQTSELEPLNRTEAEKAGELSPYVNPGSDIADYSSHFDVPSRPLSESDSEKDYNSNLVCPKQNQGNSKSTSRDEPPRGDNHHSPAKKMKGRSDPPGPKSTSCTSGAEEYSVIAEGEENQTGSPYVPQAGMGGMVQQSRGGNDGYLSNEDLVNMGDQSQDTSPGYLPHYVASSKAV